MTFRRELLPSPTAYFQERGVKLTGKGKWRTAACPFHGGSDSLRINVATGGYVCMNCGAKGGDLLAYHQAAHGLEFVDAAKSLGAWDGRDDKQYQRAASRLSARSALEVLAFEATIVSVCAANVARGHPLSKADLSRMLAATARITHIAEAFK